jgi:hypothetical protein
VTLVEQAARGVAVPYEVIQWGAGNTGAYSLHFLLADPALNGVGVWVNREQNVGRTAGELAGLAANGPCATRNVDDLVALDADCVVYMAAEPSGPPNEPGTDGWESVETLCRLLDSGAIASTVVSLRGAKILMLERCRSGYGRRARCLRLAGRCGVPLAGGFMGVSCVATRPPERQS